MGTNDEISHKSPADECTACGSPFRNASLEIWTAQLSVDAGSKADRDTPVEEQASTLRKMKEILDQLTD